jgi:SET family sugar efflux transporter-like MFS transporter
MNVRDSLVHVWRTEEYRAILLLMVLMALGFSSAVPLISLYLVRDLGAGLSTAGLFFAVQALPGLLLGVLIGRWSDRWRSRALFLRGAVLWVGMGWLILAVTASAWLALLTGAVFLCFGGVLLGQGFATLQDVMTRKGETQQGLVNTIVRTGWSFGWVFGPLAGSALASLAGIRAAFIAASCMYLLCLIPLRTFRTRLLPAVPRTDAPARRPYANLPLIVFTALCAIVVSGQAIKNGYLAIDVTEHLRGSMGSYGTILAVSPVVELVVMPLSGVLAQRVGLGRVIAVGLAMVVVEYVLLTASTMLWQLYIVQAMDACVVAVVMGLGVTYAQRLSPRHPGAANGIFFSGFNVAAILGGLVGSAGVPMLGVPHIFLIPAAFGALACGGFLGLERTVGRHARGELNIPG